MKPINKRNKLSKTAIAISMAALLTAAHAASPTVDPQLTSPFAPVSKDAPAVSVTETLVADTAPAATPGLFLAPLAVTPGYARPPIDASELANLENFAIEAPCFGTFNNSDDGLIERQLAAKVTERRVRGCDSPTYIEAHRGVHTVRANLRYERDVNGIDHTVINESNAATGGTDRFGGVWNCARSRYGNPAYKDAVPEQYYIGFLFSALCNGSEDGWAPRIWEIDPRKTKDGQWVLSHDATLNRQFVMSDDVNFSRHAPARWSPSTAAEMRGIPPVFLKDVEYSRLQKLRPAVWDRSGRQFYTTNAGKINNLLLYNFVQDHSVSASGSVVQLHIRSINDIREIASKFILLSRPELPLGGFFLGERLTYSWFTIHLSDLCAAMKTFEFQQRLNPVEREVWVSVDRVLREKNVRSSVGCLALLPAIGRYINLTGNYLAPADRKIKLQVNIFNDTDFTGLVKDPWSGQLVPSRIAAAHGIYSLDGPVTGVHKSAPHGGLTFLGFDDTNFSSENLDGIARMGSWAHRNGYLVLRTDLYPDSKFPERSVGTPNGPGSDCLLNTEGYAWDRSRAWCPSPIQMNRGSSTAFMTGRLSDPAGEFGKLVRPDILLTDNPGRAYNFLHQWPNWPTNQPGPGDF